MNIIRLLVNLKKSTEEMIEYIKIYEEHQDKA